MSQRKIKTYFTNSGSGKKRTSSANDDHEDEITDTNNNNESGSCSGKKRTLAASAKPQISDAISDAISDDTLAETEILCPSQETPPSSLPSNEDEGNEVIVVGSKTFGNNTPSTIVTSAHGLNENSPSQPCLKKFPTTMCGAALRSFNSSWYKGRPWLEYSIEKDAAYCFPCRVFGVNASSTTFSVEGFHDWKHALDGWNELDNLKDTNKKKLKGFAKHVTSSWHIHNLAAWKDRECRESSGLTIESVVSKLNDDNAKWVEVIFHVIRHLAADGLPLRGRFIIILNLTTLLSLVESQGWELITVVNLFTMGGISSSSVFCYFKLK